MAQETECYRPHWDDYFMALARIIAMRGTCNRLRAGAILVKKNRIVASGYNGSPPGLPHCDEEGHLLEEGHCIRTIHGEHNAILQAAVVSGVSTEGSIMYTKYNPCMHCAKYVVAAGITRVVVGKIYRGEQALDYLKSSGIQVDLYQENPIWNKMVQGLFETEIEQVAAKEGDVKIKTEP